MKCFTIFFSGLVWMAACSCKKVISINLNSASPQIVIVGEVTNAAGPYQVQISKTVNFSDPNTFPAVSGALVTIADNQGLLDTLMENAPGNYVSHNFWQGTPLHSYTLSVLAEGIIYTGISTMPPAVPLDSVGFYFDHSRGSQTIIEAIPYFQDPPGMANYYQFIENVNGRPLTEIFIFSDQFSDGKYISQPLFDDSTYSRLLPGDDLVLSMYSIDQSTYGYLNTLQQISATNPIQSVTPANPNTNLSGGALGYFSAHTTESKEVTVP
jgi:Domain of unknown function (DUF4249)